MIRVYAVVHVPTRVLGPNRACDPHIPFISAGPQSTRLRGSRPHQPNKDCGLSKMNHGAVTG